MIFSDLSDINADLQLLPSVAYCGPQVSVDVLDDQGNTPLQPGAVSAAVKKMKHICEVHYGHPEKPP